MADVNKNWIDLTADFPKNVPFTRIRFDFDKAWSITDLDHLFYFAEKPDVDITKGMKGEAFGYADDYRGIFNAGRPIFASRVDGFVDRNIKTIPQVEGTNMYEWVFQKPIYWAGQLRSQDIFPRYDGFIKIYVGPEDRLKWIDLTQDIDRSVPIKAVRWDVNVGVPYTEVFISEKPNIYSDGKQLNGEEYGWAYTNRSNTTQNYYSLHYYGFVDKRYTTGGTLVEGTTSVYQVNYPKDYYFAGLAVDIWSGNEDKIAQKIKYAIAAPLDTDKSLVEFTSDGGVDTVTVDAEYPFTMTQEGDWFTAELDDNIITVTAKKNYVLGKKGKIILTDTEGDTAEILVKQAKADDIKYPLNSLYIGTLKLN